MNPLRFSMPAVLAAMFVSRTALDRSGAAGCAAPDAADRDVDAQPGRASARMVPYAESRDMVWDRGGRRNGAATNEAARGGDNVMGAEVPCTPAPDRRAAFLLSRCNY